MIGGTTGILGEWGVERADNQYDGPLPMRQHSCLVEERSDGPNWGGSGSGFRPQAGKKSWDSR